MSSPEELPEDLRGLTRRHAQELSSSRWKYDSEQLTNVLAKFIEPKPQPKPKANPEATQRPFVPKQPQPKSWWAKNYLWLIGGFVGLLILIGMCVPDETTYEPLVENEYVTEATDPGQANLNSGNPEENEIYNSLQLEESVPNLAGRWTGVNDLGITYFYGISQDGASISFNEISYDGSIIGNGSGVINGEYINLDYKSVFDYSGSITLIISSDQSQLSGQVGIPSSGLSAPMVLSRN